MTVRKWIPVLILFSLIYISEFAYIWYFSDVIAGEVRTTAIIAGCAFIIQAILLLIFSFLISVGRARYRFIKIVALTIAVYLSSIRVITWAQLSDDRYSLKIDPIYEVLYSDTHEHIFANIMFLLICSGLSYFIFGAIKKAKE